MAMAFLYVPTRLPHPQHPHAFVDLNLPICGVALVLCVVFMQLPTPTGTLKEKMKKMDWM